jgi:hypothetical protein
MNELLQTADELRRMSEAELVEVFDDSLTQRLRDQADEALERHGGLGPGNLETFLEDRDSVRFPTRLVLEFGPEMATHQFAQPEPDIRQAGGVMLYLRPILGQRPDLIVLAVSYMIPVINYGKLINDEHCVEYGSRLMRMDKETYYQRICEIAEFVGAEALDANDPRAHVVEDEPAVASSGCGSGCGCPG